MTQSQDRHDEPSAHRASEFGLMIGSWLTQGARRFDPVGFHFIESMARRSLQHQGPVKQLLENKLATALADYRVRFETARAATADLVACVAERYPDAAEDVQRLFAEGDFRGVTQLNAHLEKRNRCVSLVALTQSLQRDKVDDIDTGQGNDHLDSHGFEALLRKQEKEALQAYGNGSAEPAATPRRPFGELKSMRLFRETWAKQTADKRVAQALGTPPENAGPLNSHKLVIRSLATMRDISPEYLNRFVSYIDTLLWLEQTGKKMEPAAEKAPSGKTKAKGSRNRST